MVRGSGTGSWSSRPWRSRSVLRGESTTTYASSKLNRVGRRAARYDSGLSAHKCTRPAHKRPAPHRIAHEQIACSRSRCGNFTPSTRFFPPPVNPCQHPSSLLLVPLLPSPQHNHARYDSFGKLTASTGSLVNAFQYTARESDTETGLYYYRARYYDPSAGRFFGEDPMGFGGSSNFYAYVSNSPISLSDPLGLQGKNPTPKMTGNDLDVFNKALELAKTTACDPNCDGALQDFGIKSLAALVNQMAANVNVFDGRKSTYPLGKQTVSQFLAQGTAGAVAFTDVQLTFLGNYFWNPTSIDSMPQQRALILLHESVHQFGGKGDNSFGGSAKLSEIIAEKCFPALKALKKLGNLTH